jgi:hypothetical protein
MRSGKKLITTRGFLKTSAFGKVALNLRVLKKIQKFNKLAFTGFSEI